MQYRDYKVGFTYEVPNNFSEVKEPSYEVFNVAPNTLSYFIELDDEGEVQRTLAINYEMDINDEEIFQEKVKQNIKDLEDNEFYVIKRNTINTDSGRTIERCVFYNEESGEQLGFLMYFMRVKNAMLVSSCFITEYYDDFENELFQVFNSIEED